MFRMLKGGAFVLAVFLIFECSAALAAPLLNPPVDARPRIAAAPALPVPDKTVRTAPVTQGRPARQGELPPGFVFPVNGSVSDVVRALNQLRAADEAAARGHHVQPVSPTAPLPPARLPESSGLNYGKAFAPRPAPRTTTLPTLPPTVVEAAPPAAESEKPKTELVYRSYRTASGARITELVERPVRAEKSLAKRPERAISSPTTTESATVQREAAPPGFVSP